MDCSAVSPRPGGNLEHSLQETDQQRKTLKEWLLVCTNQAVVERPRRRLAAWRVLDINMAIVNGPTPPGTGV